MVKNPVFSIVIIGFNTEQSLKILLASIEKVIWKEEAIEVIYIDDGSSDNSLSVFKKYNLKFKKICFGFKNNVGRVVARNKGIKLSSGEWMFFLNSNVVVDNNIIQAYSRAIKNNVTAIGGKIIYDSKDSFFKTYLNHVGRGINQYRQYAKIEYRHLLFGNCIIRREIFDDINLNLGLTSYGGEELDFSYRLWEKKYGDIIACQDAVVRRRNHPGLMLHCSRLDEFGKNNFKKLLFELQVMIVRYSLLLKQNIVLSWLILFINKLFCRLYLLGFKSFIIIKIIILTTILKGYYSRN